MRETVRLGHVAGVRVGANWTVLVVFVLVLVGLAGGQLPVTHPDQPAWAYALAGTVAAVVFLLSLLAHELAHAVVARRNGIRVEGITLWLFGGVARLLDEAADPGTDLRVAGVGPLASLLLGSAFAGAALVSSGLGADGLALGVLTWLAVINGVLAVFNLVPAAPLDGGRLLRGLLWHRHGDRRRAAVTAARAGRTFGLVLVGLGLAEIVLLPGFGGLWLVLLGWFVSSAAGAEEQQAELVHALTGITAGDVMSREVVTVPARLSVADLVEGFVWRYRFSAFPVLDEDGGLCGLVTLNRVKDVPVEQRPQVPVERIAQPAGEIVLVDPDTPLVEVLPRLGDGERRALVRRDGAILGLISPTDVVRALELAQLHPRGDRAHL